MLDKRDQENIDVAAALFDANSPTQETSKISVEIPADVLAHYYPGDMIIEGPHEDGSILVGLRLYPIERVTSPIPEKWSIND